MINEKDIVRKYLGAQYKHKGRDIKTGLDCWGLIKSVYHDLGIELFDLDDYEANWAKKGKNHFIDNYHEQWEKVDGEKKFLDVVLFANPESVVSHAGIVLTPEKFIHCCKIGVVVSRMGDLHWFQRFVGVYRYKNDKS